MIDERFKNGIWHPNESDYIRPLADSRMLKKAYKNKVQFENITFCPKTYKTLRMVINQLRKRRRQNT